MTAVSDIARLYSKATLTIDQLEQRIAAYVPQPHFPHDEFIKICMEEACLAIREGNSGVGSCLVKDGHVVVRGHNRRQFPYTRSDLHGEMAVMTNFEDTHKNAPDMDKYTLFTTLEPCPMCTVRLITSGVGKVFWAARDAESGMMATLDRLTPVWIEMAKRQEFADAECSPELSDLATQVWLVSSSKAQRAASR